MVKTFRKSVENAQRREPIVALVGFREWIFSGKVRGTPDVRLQDSIHSAPQCGTGGCGPLV